MNIIDTEISKIGTENDHGLTIDWMIANHCNYACNYCDPMLYGNTSGWPNVNSAISFFDKVHNHLNDNEKMLTLTGGEPTLWPDLFYFLENIHESYNITIVSNGSRSLRWWNKLSETKRIKHLVISVHMEYANIDYISQVIDVMSKNTRVAVFVVMNPFKITEAKKFAIDLKEKDLYCKILLKSIMPNRNISDKFVYTYDKETLKFMNEWHYWKKNNNITSPSLGNSLYINNKKTNNTFMDLVNNRLNCFKGWKCNIIKNRLAIGINGDIKGATCSTAKNFKIGNINNDNIDLTSISKDPVICKDTWCGCIDDIKIPKEKI